VGRRRSSVIRNLSQHLGDSVFWVMCHSPPPFLRCSRHASHFTRTSLPAPLVHRCSTFPHFKYVELRYFSRTRNSHVPQVSPSGPDPQGAGVQRLATAGPVPFVKSSPNRPLIGLPFDHASTGPALCRIASRAGVSVGHLSSTQNATIHLARGIPGCRSACFGDCRERPSKRRFCKTAGHPDAGTRHCLAPPDQRDASSRPGPLHAVRTSSACTSHQIPTVWRTQCTAESWDRPQSRRQSTGLTR
jgi:hypothetical protein